MKTWRVRFTLIPSDRGCITPPGGAEEGLRSFGPGGALPVFVTACGSLDAIACGVKRYRGERLRMSKAGRVLAWITRKRSQLR